MRPSIPAHLPLRRRPWIQAGALGLLGLGTNHLTELRGAEVQRVAPLLGPEFAAGELVPPFESFDAVTRGAADLMHAAPYYWPNKNKGLQFFSAVPFGMTASETAAWMEFGGGQQLLP